MSFIQKVKLTNAGLSVYYRNFGAVFFNDIIHCLINHCMYSTNSLGKNFAQASKTSIVFYFALVEGIWKERGGKKIVE